MSYSRRCAEAPIGRILVKANEHPDWEAEVLDTNELCLRSTKDSGHIIFGFVDVVRNPETTTTSVACYGAPSDKTLNDLRSLIRSAK